MREDEHEERQRERQRNARRNVWRQIRRGCELGQQGWSWGTDRCLWSGSGRSSAFREKKSHLARGPQVQGPDNGSQMSVAESRLMVSQGEIEEGKNGDRLILGVGYLGDDECSKIR